MRTSLPLLAALALVAACSDAVGPAGRGLTIRPELVRVGSAGAPSALWSASAPGASASRQGTTAAATVTSDVEILSLRAPIRRIELAGNGSHAEVYECPASTATGCLVELTGPALLDLLHADDASVPAGAYDAIRVHSCTDGGGYEVQVTARATIGGTTYVTTAAGVAPGTTAEPVAVPHAGCVRSYPIPGGLRLTDSLGTDVPLKLYFDLTSIAWMGAGAESAWLAGGCSGTPQAAQAGGAFVCVAYPDVAGSLGSSSPVIERYRIGNFATVGLYFTADTDRPIGGYTRRHYPSDEVRQATFVADVPVGIVTPLGEGRYMLSSGGASDGTTSFTFMSFWRSTHTGWLTDHAGVSSPYTAVRLP